MGAELELGRRPDATLEERVDRLEQDVDEIKQRHRATVKLLNDRIGEVEQKAGTAVGDLRAELAEQEAKRRADLSDSLLFQKIGGGLFVAGVILSVLGNVVNC